MKTNNTNTQQKTEKNVKMQKKSDEIQNLKLTKLEKEKSLYKQIKCENKKANSRKQKTWKKIHWKPKNSLKNEKTKNYGKTKRNHKLKKTLINTISK